MKRIRTVKRSIRRMLSGTIAVVLLACAFSGCGGVTVSVETSLKEMITASQLRTAEYTYNSIVGVGDGDKIEYHVAYKGTVVAGFDFENVEIVREEDIIRIVVPDVEILEVTVDPKMEYIFVKSKYDTEETYVEATEACKKDLREKAEANDTLLNTARESAVDTLVALVKPFESGLEDGVRFEIVFDTEMEADAQ